MAVRGSDRRGGGHTGDRPVWWYQEKGLSLYQEGERVSLMGLEHAPGGHVSITQAGADYKQGSDPLQMLGC